MTGCGQWLPKVKLAARAGSIHGKPKAHGLPQNCEVLWLEFSNSPPRPIGERIDFEVWLPVT